MTNQEVHLTVIGSEKQRMSYIGLISGLAVQTGIGNCKEKTLLAITLKQDSLEGNS